MANPGGSANYVADFWAPISIFLLLAIITSTARLYRRARPVWRLTSDDYTFAFAFSLVLAWFALEAVLYLHGRGNDATIVDPPFAVPLEVASGLVSLCALNVIRISVSLMLLPLVASAWWQWANWIIIVVNIGLIITSTTVEMLACRPLRALWEPVPDVVCLTPDQLYMFGKVYTSFNMISNLALSLLPFTFIHHIRRPFVEQATIASLMVAGLGATAFEITKLVWLLGAFASSDFVDSAWLDVRTDLIAGLELLVGLIAASLPKLKAPIYNALCRLGLFTPTAASFSSTSAPTNVELPDGLAPGRAFANYRGRHNRPGRQRPSILSGISMSLPGRRMPDKKNDSEAGDVSLIEVEASTGASSLQGTSLDTGEPGTEVADRVTRYSGGRRQEIHNVE